MNFLYFDPGLGAMVVQAIVAAVAGVLLFSKNVVYKIKLFFGLVEERSSIDDIDATKPGIEKKEKGEE